MTLNKDTINKLKSVSQNDMDLTQQKRLLDLLKKPNAELTSEDHNNRIIYLQQLFESRLGLKPPTDDKAVEKAIRLKLAELEELSAKQKLLEEEQLMLDIMRQLILGGQKFLTMYKLSNYCNFTLVQHPKNSSKEDVGLLMLKDYNQQFNQNVKPEPDGTIKLSFKSEEEAFDFLKQQAKLGREFKIRDSSGNIYEAKNGKLHAVSQQTVAAEKPHTVILDDEEDSSKAHRI